MAELTAIGKLRRHASFKGLRADKTSDELRTELLGHPLRRDVNWATVE